VERRKRLENGIFLRGLLDPIPRDGKLYKGRCTPGDGSLVRGMQE